MSVRQIAQAFRDSMTIPIFSPVVGEFDNLTAQVNTALRGIGAWTSVAYSPGSFVGKGAMSWTTQASNVTAFEFLEFGVSGFAGGATQIIHLLIAGTSVGGTLNNALNVTLPNSRVARGFAAGSYSYRDNGTYGTGIWETTTASSVMSFYKGDKTNWSASTIATDLRATLIVSIQ